jgi:hypothetical protein
MFCVSHVDKLNLAVYQCFEGDLRGGMELVQSIFLQQKDTILEQLHYENRLLFGVYVVQVRLALNFDWRSDCGDQTVALSTTRQFDSTILHTDCHYILPLLLQNVNATRHGSDDKSQEVCRHASRIPSSQGRGQSLQQKMCLYTDKFLWSSIFARPLFVLGGVQIFHHLGVIDIYIQLAFFGNDVNVSNF